MFVTLTYDPSHVPVGNDCFSLCRDDVALFLKRYKARYNLCNTDFSYFGCGEYGDKFDRPHAHLLFFGDDVLYEKFDRSVLDAEHHVQDVWKKGHVDVNIAQWSGVHYVTKYVLKENPDDWNGIGKEKPFTIVSHGLGLRWLDTPQAIELKKQLQWLAYNKDWLLEQFLQPIDMSNIVIARAQVSRIIAKMREYYPSFKVLLPSGKSAFLPRELRRRLIGSFEHFKDNPLWLWNLVNSLRDALDYYYDHGDYDRSHEMPVSLQESLQRVEKIRKRLILNKRKKLNS